MNLMNDDVIIKGLKNGDEEAYRYIYTRYYVMLCRLASQLLGNFSLAEEVVDDVIFNLWKNRVDLNVTISLRAYLLTAVRNRCFNELNSLEARLAADSVSVVFLENKGLLDQIFVDEEHPLGSLLAHELEDKVKDAVAHLPEPCRTVFIKSRVKQKTYDEIAKDLNISLNTVKYHIKNALNILRICLADYLKLFLLIWFAEF